MTLDRRRRRVLIGIFALAMAITTLVLFRVLGTAFFAVTVAYVLYPVRQWVTRRGRGRRVSAALATLVGLLAAIAAVVPMVGVLYVRRKAFIAFVQELPEELPVSAFGFEYVIDVSVVFDQLQAGVTALAVNLASAAPVLGLKAGLFFLLVYALLLRPGDIRLAIMQFVPHGYHDLALSFHERVRSTLYAIYVLQAATAFGTFIIGYVVFAMLGYDSPFVLGVLAGLMQFIPIIGPSVIVGVLAVYELSVGNVPGAILVTTFGVVLVGFLPDALIRPRLAAYTAGMPGALYFVGFTGGVLTVGLVGLIAGPLAVGLLLEAASLLSEEMGVDRAGGE